MRVRKLLPAAGLACSIVALQAGPAMASTVNACVLTTGQASSVLGSAAPHGKPTSIPAAHEALCDYVTSSGASAISITAAPASGFPSPSLLKMTEPKASVSTLHGIGTKAEIVKPKDGKEVQLVFAAGKSYYTLTLSAGHKKVTSKQISLLESVSKAAAKKL